MSDLLKFTVPGSPEYVKIAKMSVESAAAVAGFTVEAIEDYVRKWHEVRYSKLPIEIVKDIEL